MLYLAQVKVNAISADKELKLLAEQQDDATWLVKERGFVSLGHDSHLPEAVLVLVELDPDQKPQEIKPASQWILQLLHRHCGRSTLTPEFLETEAQRLENWRRELTVQNLELTRIRLEVEAQREELQELEASLKREQEKLQLRLKEQS